MTHQQCLAGIDAAAFGEVEAAVFARPWSPNTFVTMPERLGFGLWEGDKCIGFIYGSVVVDEAELWRVAVLPAYRRQGLAHLLLNAFAQACQQRGGTTMFLEVSALNASALAFYRAEGFQEQGRRRNYYGAGDDALLLSLALG